MQEPNDSPGIKREPLYQVWATEIATGQLVPIPIFPRIGRQVAEEWAATVRMMIATGREKRYADPQALLHMPSDDPN